MKGYWNRPLETSHAFSSDGHYLTGDMAFRDSEGCLFIINRKDDMIKTGGLNVYPSEVEAVLISRPEVEEAAVIGLPHSKWQTAVTAVVKLKQNGNLSEEDLRSYCKKSIGGYKIPKKYSLHPHPFPALPWGR